jgi:hypothetical protein
MDVSLDVIEAREKSKVVGLNGSGQPGSRKPDASHSGVQRDARNA